MVGRAKRPLGQAVLARLERDAARARNRRDLERLVGGRGRQQARQALREHALAAARRADQ